LIFIGILDYGFLDIEVPFNEALVELVDLGVAMDEGLVDRPEGVDQAALAELDLLEVVFEVLEVFTPEDVVLYVVFEERNQFDDFSAENLSGIVVCYCYEEVAIDLLICHERVDLRRNQV